MKKVDPDFQINQGYVTRNLKEAPETIRSLRSELSSLKHILNELTLQVGERILSIRADASLAIPGGSPHREERINGLVENRMREDLLCQELTRKIAETKRVIVEKNDEIAYWRMVHTSCFSLANLLAAQMFALAASSMKLPDNS